MIDAARINLFFIILLMAGCAGTDRAPHGESPGTGMAQKAAPSVAEAPVAAPPQPIVKQDADVAAPPQPAVKQDANVAAKPSALPEAVPVPAPTPAPDPIKAAVPAAKSPAKIVATPAPKAPAPIKEGAVPAAAKPAPLDLTLLEKRLKETPAIGVFTKLTLKNQVDDLLDQFRAYYQGRAKITLAALRQPYDQLILKVLSLLQDGDPPLARAIVESREAIWGILSDPDKFKNL